MKTKIKEIEKVAYVVSSYIHANMTQNGIPMQDISDALGMTVRSVRRFVNAFECDVVDDVVKSEPRAIPNWHRFEQSKRVFFGEVQRDESEEPKIGFGAVIHVWTVKQNEGGKVVPFQIDVRWWFWTWRQKVTIIP